jgi:hypothetical protein
MSATIKLDTTKLNQLIASVPNRADELTRKAAFMIEQQAKMNIQAWPLIDTGALLNSIAVERIKKSNYQVGDFGGYTRQRKSRFGWRQVSAGMEYGVFWELGHRNIFTRHYMRMPFLGPAVVKVENKFVEMLTKDLIK